MQYKNGCHNAPGCPGEPTHIYRPNGGVPVAYCVSCMPRFVRAQISKLQTTAAYLRIEDQVKATLAVDDSPIIGVVDDAPDELAEQPAQDQPAVKKTRRTRKKKEDAVEVPEVEEAE